jgi:signal peptidase I
MSGLHFKAVVVRGDSMAPNYNDGDWLLFRILPTVKMNQISARKLNGKVVLIQRNSQVGKDFLQVKRATKVTILGVWVEGDNKKASTDSRSWGVLDSSEVIGKLILRYRRAR